MLSLVGPIITKRRNYASRGYGRGLEILWMQMQEGESGQTVHHYRLELLGIKWAKIGALIRLERRNQHGFMVESVWAGVAANTMSGLVQRWRADEWKFPRTVPPASSVPLKYPVGVEELFAIARGCYDAGEGAPLIDWCMENLPAPFQKVLNP